MIGVRKKVTAIILITIVSVAVAWVILSQPPREVLPEEEIRLLITENPIVLHFEMKPETIEFLSVELVPIEGSPLTEDINRKELSDKVWVVKYECKARAVPLPDMAASPFTRHFVQVVIDAYTGEELSFHAEVI